MARLCSRNYWSECVQDIFETLETKETDQNHREIVQFAAIEADKAERQKLENAVDLFRSIIISSKSKLLKTNYSGFPMRKLLFQAYGLFKRSGISLRL